MSVVRQGKKATHKCFSIKGGVSSPEKVQGPMSSVLVAADSSSSLHKQTRRDPLSREVYSLWEIMTWCSLPDYLKSQAHSRVKPSPINRMVTASAGVQSDLSKVVHSSCRSICFSSEPQSSIVHISSPRPTCLGHICSEHNLVGSHCLCLPSLSGWSKNQAKQLPYHSNSPRLARDALVLGPSAALNRDPTPVTSVNNTSQTVPQPSVSQQSTTFEPPHLVSKSGQLQEQGFSVEVAERISAPQRSPTRTIYKSKWALFEKMVQRKFGGFFHSLCETSPRLFSCTCTKI